MTGGHNTRTHVFNVENLDTTVYLGFLSNQKPQL